MDDKEPLLLRFTVALVLMSVAVYAFWLYQADQTADDAGVNQQIVNSESSTKQEAIVAAFYEVDHASVAQTEEPPEITGDEEADERIREIAVQRGYRLQLQADEADLVEVDERRVLEEVRNSWEEMQKAALEDGVELILARGYVSIEEQRDDFLDALYERGVEQTGREYTTAQIQGGTADTAINATLRRHAIPGYSKHHSGLVVDIIDSSEDDFRGSAAYEWLRSDSFANAAEFGFIPSFPEDSPQQGMNPRAEEFVWVGADRAEELRQ